MFLTFKFSVLAKYDHLHLTLFSWAGINERDLNTADRAPPSASLLFCSSPEA